MASATAAVTAKAAEDVAQKENEQEAAELETGDGTQEAVDVTGEGSAPAGGTGGTGDAGGTHTHGMPFKMKASNHGNSPIEKNFGSKEARGFPMKSFGINSTEKEGGVGSEMEPPLKSSPAKGLWGKLKAKANKMLGIDKDGAARGIVEQGGVGTQNNAVSGVGNAQTPPHSHNPGDGSVEAPGEPSTGKVQVADATEKVKQEPSTWGGTGDANANLSV